MARDSQLHALDLDGFWMDVGQPKDYLTGTGLYLSFLQKMASSSSRNGDDSNLIIKNTKNIVSPVMIHPSAIIGQDCKIGPNVVVGAGVVIGDGVRISRSVIFEGSIIKSNSCVANTIVGWNGKVGRWSRTEGVTVLGDDVSIADEVYINGASILPHKEITANITEPRIVM